MAAKLILTRKGSMLNRRQPFRVFVDGVEAGQVKNDDTEEFTLTPGTHTVHAKISWMSSAVESIEIKEGENTYRTLGSGLKFIGPLYVLMLIGVLFPFYFHFIKTPVPDYVGTLKTVLIFPAIIYYILYISVFRKNYLVIAEDKSSPFK
jgi:hypothetical protein